MNNREVLFMHDDERLRAAMARSLEIFHPTAELITALTEISPHLQGSGKDSFLLTLHSLGRCAEMEQLSIHETATHASAALRLIDEGEVTGIDDKGTVFLADLRILLDPLSQVAQQVVANAKRTGSDSTPVLS